MALDGLDGGVGADLHVRRTEEGGAGVAARDAHDGGHHQVLDERARDDDLKRQPVTSGNFGRDRSRGEGNGHVGSLVLSVRCERRDDVLGGVGAREGGLELGAEVVDGAGGPIGLRAKREGEGLLDGDVNMLVHLFVVDDDVHVVRRKVLLDVEHLGRLHAVELAHLGGALQHLHGVGVVGDLVLRTGRGRESVSKESRTPQQ